MPPRNAPGPMPEDLKTVRQEITQAFTTVLNNLTGAPEDLELLLDIANTVRNHDLNLYYKLIKLYTLWVSSPPVQGPETASPSSPAA